MAAADDIRKRTMQSHLFSDDVQPYQQVEQNSPAIQNRRKELQSQITFGDEPAPNLPSNPPPRNQYAQRPLPPLADLPPPPQNNHVFSNNYHPPSISQPNNDNQNGFSLRQQSASYQQSNPTHQPQAPMAQPNFPAPHQARFIQTPIRAAALPKYDGLVQNAELPSLSPFPDFSINDPPISTDFQFHVKPMTSTGSRQNRKLNSTAGVEMAKMRQEFEKDSFDFQGRLAKIQPISLIQPVYQIPAQDYIPPISSRSSLSTPHVAEY